MYWQGFEQRLIAAVDIIRESAVESVLNRILYQCVMPDGSVTEILFYYFFYKQIFFYGHLMPLYIKYTVLAYA